MPKRDALAHTRAPNTPQERPLLIWGFDYDFTNYDFKQPMNSFQTYLARGVFNWRRGDRWGEGGTDIHSDANVVAFSPAFAPVLKVRTARQEWALGPWPLARMARVLAQLLRPECMLRLNLAIVVKIPGSR